jgi:hypothetical protein
MEVDMAKIRQVGNPPTGEADRLKCAMLACAVLIVESSCGVWLDGGVRGNGQRLRDSIDSMIETSDAQRRVSDA